MKTIARHPTRLDRTSRMKQAFYATLNRTGVLPASRRYNLTICQEKKFVWFRVAKVATRTIIEHFREHGLELDVEHAYSVMYNPASYADYFKFSFVRDPLERFLSCWRDKVVRHQHFRLPGGSRDCRDFLDFASELDLDTCDPHLRRQRSLIDVNNLDYLGRQESFAEDFHAICNRLGIPCGMIQSYNMTRRNRQFEVHDEMAIRQRVWDLYRLDYQVFGYGKPM